MTIFIDLFWLMSKQIEHMHFGFLLIFYVKHDLDKFLTCFLRFTEIYISPTMHCCEIVQFWFMNRVLSLNVNTNGAQYSEEDKVILR